MTAERPLLPAPHQVIAAFVDSVFGYAPNAPRSLVYHSGVTLSATLLGFASHAPGGLGVFDAAMLVALWQFDKESVLAGLLLFRMLYYLVPFVVALIILGTREIVLNMRGARAKPALRPVKSVTAPLRSEIEAEKTSAD